MLELDTATFLVTQDNAAGPVTRLVDDGFAPHAPVTSADGSVSKVSAAAYLVAYGLLAGFVGYLFLAI